LSTVFWGSLRPLHGQKPAEPPLLAQEWAAKYYVVKLMAHGSWQKHGIDQAQNPKHEALNNIKIQISNVRNRCMLPAFRIL